MSDKCLLARLVRDSVPMDPGMKAPAVLCRKYNEQGAKMLPDGLKTDSLFYE